MLCERFENKIRYTAVYGTLTYMVFLSYDQHLYWKCWLESICSWSHWKHNENGTLLYLIGDPSKISLMSPQQQQAIAAAQHLQLLSQLHPQLQSQLQGQLGQLQGQLPPSLQQQQQQALLNAVALAANRGQLATQHHSATNSLAPAAVAAAAAAAAAVAHQQSSAHHHHTAEPQQQQSPNCTSSLKDK